MEKIHTKIYSNSILENQLGEGEINPKTAAIRISNKSDVTGFGGVLRQYFLFTNSL